MIIIAALEAPGVVAGLDDIAVMCEAVEQGCRHLGVAEHAGPFAEGEVRGDDDGGALVYARYSRVGAENGRLAGEVIVFTGFLSVHRGEAASLAAAAGCAVADSVTKKTTILIVGDQDLRLTKGQEKSAKHRRAEELIAQGGALRIVRESDFRIMIE